MPFEPLVRPFLVLAQSNTGTLALPSAEFRQYINAPQRYLGPVALSIRLFGLSRLHRRRSCRRGPGNCGGFAPTPRGHRTGVKPPLGWLSDQDSNLNRLNSNLEERAVIASVVMRPAW